MARKSSGSSTSTTMFKTGDVIWVPYRKSPRWPAVIKNVYPKKLTYYFLPETGPRSATFKTTPKTAVLFKDTDQLPANASKELQAAYKAALAIVRGEAPIRRSNSASLNNHSESAETVSPSTSSNNSSLVDVPATKKPRKTVEGGREFIEYTVILVESSEGFDWPALLTDVSGTLASVRKFPFNENKDILDFPYARCRNVTYEELDELIKRYDTGEYGIYVRALIAAEEFMDNPQRFLNAPKGFECGNGQHGTTNTPKKDVVMKEENKSKNKPLQNGLSLSNLSLNSSKNLIFKMMLSFDARDYIERVWGGHEKCERSEKYEVVNDPSDACLSFYCGNLLDFNELEVVIAEVRNWIALCPKLPKMTLLREMHYISKVVLPEICVFALAKVKNLSHADAEAVYQDSVAKFNGENAAAPVSTNSSFQQLLRAVSIERSAPGR